MNKPTLSISTATYPNGHTAGYLVFNPATGQLVAWIDCYIPGGEAPFRRDAERIASNPSIMDGNSRARQHAVDQRSRYIGQPSAVSIVECVGGTFDPPLPQPRRMALAA